MVILYVKRFIDYIISLLYQLAWNRNHAILSTYFIEWTRNIYVK